jgi:hypothetical protein
MLCLAYLKEGQTAPEISGGFLSSCGTNLISVHLPNDADEL